MGESSFSALAQREEVFIGDSGLPAPFEYKRYYAYECANPACHSFGCKHEPRCKIPHTTPRLLNWTSVPVPVCDRCWLNHRQWQKKNLCL